MPDSKSLAEAPPARFERATNGLEGRCSIQLSYGGVSLLLADSNDFDKLLCSIAYCSVSHWVVKAAACS